jgi:hypothetical protein
MSMKRLALLSCMTPAVLALGIAACGGDLTLPDAKAGVALRVVDGDGQLGTVGEALPSEVIVEVKTDAGAPIVGSQVAFMTSGAAPREEFDPAVAQTDAQGRASTRWVLGTVPGPYAAEARVVVEGDSTVTAVPLRADAVAGDPDSLRATSDTSRSGRRGQTFDEPLSVIVVDRFGNPVGGADVAWKVSGDDGSVSAEQTQTAADGTASVMWTLGNRIGVEKVEAKVEKASGSPVTFTSVVFF